MSNTPLEEDDTQTNKNKTISSCSYVFLLIIKLSGNKNPIMQTPTQSKKSHPLFNRSKRDLFLSNFTYPSMPSSYSTSLYDGKKVQVAGRFKFTHIIQSHQKINIHIPMALKLGSEFLWSEVLLEDDLILARGIWTGTAIQVEELSLIAPNLLNENPDFLNFNVGPQLLEQWNTFLRTIKEYFFQKEFIEIETPTLVQCPGTEPSLEPFFTQLKVGSKTLTLALPTSPELSLKKALSYGYTKIFEIKNCFRNDEIGPHHLTEFHMLEWYRGFDNLESIEVDLKELLQKLKPEISMSKISISELWKKVLDFDLSPQTTFSELVALCKKLNIETHMTDAWNDLYFRVFLEKIEPHLKTWGPLIIYNFPPSQAALARLTKDGWADRFELYINGLEIANAFHELNDPQEQKRRFEKDLEEKRRLDKSEIQIDQEFLQALNYGMPPSGGIALGLERLFMAIYNVESINSLKLFHQHLSTED